MKLSPFALERWFAEYEFNARINMCASCACETTTADLLRLEGPHAQTKYLNLGLDYTQNPGDPELRRVLSQQYKGLGPEHIQVTTGASEAIFLLMLNLLEPGDNIIVEFPIYQSLFSIAEAMGVEIRKWYLREENNFLPELADLEPLIDQKTKMVVINNPHSPTGAVLGRQQLASLVTLVERHNLTLLSDEVYGGTVYDPRDFVPPAVVLSEKAITIGDITKPYGLGGLRVGWIASHDRSLLEKCASVRDYTTMCNAAPAEFLSIIAVEHREEIIKNKMEIARENLRIFHDFVRAHRDILSFVPPKGGFSVFPRYNLPLDSKTFCEGLIKSKNVLLMPGYAFGVENHFRLGLGKPTDVFRTGLELFGEYLATLR